MSKIGLAADVGTTTIDMCLVSLDSGEIIDEAHFKNRQSLYGSDVINRIFNASRDIKLLNKMKTYVVEDIEEALTDMLSRNGYIGDGGLTESDVLNKICICGNTTMISILLEYELEGLGVFPFEKKLSGSVCCMAHDVFGDSFPVDCELILSGCASAFIGGDVLSGMVHLTNMADSMFDRNHISLLLDLGTNGEMVLCNKGDYIAASTACGPAFEGSLRRQHVYGATAIDALALGIKTGNISRDGVLKKSYFERGIDIMGVHLDMDIIHQLIPAKAAIITGISFLAEEADISLSDIERVYLAGGFGFYLNIESAVTIGLLPKQFEHITIALGNTSLLGACDLMRSAEQYELLEHFTEAGVIKILQLADKDNFQSRLIDNMNFEVR